MLFDLLVTVFVVAVSYFLFGCFAGRGHQWEYFLIYLGMKHSKITLLSKRPMRIHASKVVLPKVDSLRFKALLHKIKKTGYINSGIHSLLEQVGTGCEPSEIMINQSAKFRLSPNILCYVFPEATKGVLTASDYVYQADIIGQHLSLDELEKVLDGWVEEYKAFKEEETEHTIEITGEYNINPYSYEFSNKFFAVLHKIKSCEFKPPGIKFLKELSLEGQRASYVFDGESAESESKKADSLTPKKCEIEPDIFCSIAHMKTVKGKEYVITIHSKKFGVDQLTSRLKVWEEEFEEHNVLKDGLKYFVFGSTNEHRRYPTDYTEFDFNSVKTFNNIFFPEKDELVEKIKFFEKNEAWFNDKGIPYTLGLLLHGQPGCGKTSTIKAIANYTQRHIISVPLKNVKTAADLYKVFYGSRINRRKIPMNKRLYILEDIDCGGLDELMKARKDKEEPKEDSEANSDEPNTKKDTKKRLLGMNPGKEKTITLSDILEVFDGVMESKVCRSLCFITVPYHTGTHDCDNHKPC